MLSANCIKLMLTGCFFARLNPIGLLFCIFHFHRKDAESAKKRYFSFAVDPACGGTGTPAKEKNQSQRDIFGL